MFQIKELREARGLNMKEAARLLNMPYTTYVNYEKGLREPTSEVLIQLADFYNTSVDYVVGRTKHTEVPATLVTAPRTSSFKLDPDEEQLVIKYRCLDDRGKSVVINVLNHEYDSLPGEKANTSAKNA